MHVSIHWNVLEQSMMNPYEQIYVWRLKCRRDFHALKLFSCIKIVSQLMCMNDERLPCKLLSNEWDKMKSKGRPKNVGLFSLIHKRKNQISQQSLECQTDKRSNG